MDMVSEQVLGAKLTLNAAGLFDFLLKCIVILTLSSIQTAIANSEPLTTNIIIGLIATTIAVVLTAVMFRAPRSLCNSISSSDFATEQDSVVVFSEGKAYWGTFRPIVEEFIRQEMPFRYRTLDLHDPALSIESSFMNAKYIAPNWLGFAELGLLSAPVMIATTPNIGTKGYPLAKPKNVQNLVHLFHHIGDIATYKKYALDNYDSIILAGEFQRDSIRQIEQIRGLKQKSLVALGLPYLDDLYEKRSISTKIKGDKISILVGSSWGPKGCLRRYGTGFINDLLDAGFSLIVRPHPQSFKSEAAFIEQCKNEASEHTSIVWDEDPSPSYAMQASDLLISDISALRFDYAFLYEKPIISLDIPKHNLDGFEAADLDIQWHESASAKIGITIDADAVTEMPDIVNQVLATDTSTDIKAFRDETLKNFGCCTPHVVAYINSLLGGLQAL